MITIKMIDARRGLYLKCKELFGDEKIAENIYNYLCEGIEECEECEPERNKGKWIKKMRITETEKYTSYDPDWYCACCGAKYDPSIARMVNFCYVCGADMRIEQDDTD